MLDVIKNKWIFMGISAVLIIAGIIGYFVNGGFNLDVDFAGGTTVTMAIGKDFNVEDIKAIYKDKAGMEPSTIQKSGDNKTDVVITSKELDSEKRDAVTTAIIEKYSLDKEKAILSVDNVSASVGRELARSAFWSALVALILMLIYITLRFEFFSGIAAICCLAHDVLIVLSFYALFKMPLNTTFIAAILTIVGYSINATIVIFDRIRENSRVMKKASFAEVANTGVNQSIFRSVMTSVTTFATIFTLYIMGVDSIKEFALPIIIGILAGTYSSVLIATPLWSIFRGKDKKAA